MLRALKPTRMALANGGGNKDPIATKYCIRAVCHMLDASNKRIWGTFTGYDKTPDIAMAVEVACTVHAASKGPGVECTEPEMLLHIECPVECGGDVTFVFYTDNEEDSDADDSARHTFL